MNSEQGTCVYKLSKTPSVPGTLGLETIKRMESH